MEFEQYFQEELAYLRHTGVAFARAYPKLAPMLAQGGNDPDVERLFEGFAFLTARIRRRLDAELPQLVHGMYALLWPELLRPQPAYTMMRFRPIREAVSSAQLIAAGTEVESVPVAGTRCRFRLCWPVLLQPLEAVAVSRVAAGGSEAIAMQLKLSAGVTTQQLRPAPLRLYLHGDAYSTAMLYFHLLHELVAVTLQVDTADGIREISLPADCVTAGGFGADDTLLADEDCAYPGHRLWREYFSFAVKFLCVDVQAGLALQQLPASQSLILSFVLRRSLPRAVRIDDDSLLLYCAPAVNLFAADAEPLRLDHQRSSYRVLPSGYCSGHQLVYSVDQVQGWDCQDRRQRPFALYLSPRAPAAAGTGSNGDYYYPLLQPRPFGDGLETHVVFLGDACDQLRDLTMTLALTCSNDDLPARLQVGDIRLATGSSPECATFSNLCVPTGTLPPPMEPQAVWQLLASVTANIGGQLDLAGLRRLLTACNFAVARDRQAARQHSQNMQALVDLQCSPQTRLHRGLPLSGWRVDLAVRGSQFACEGDMYLFLNILRHFLRATAGINEFSELVVQDTDQKGVYRWTMDVATSGRNAM